MSLENFSSIKKTDSGTFILTDDISIPDSFTSIEKFSATLDGNGYTISGLTTSFIQSATAESVLRNITFTDVQTLNIVRKNSGIIDSVTVRETEFDASDSKGGIITSKNTGVIQETSVSATVKNGETVGSIARINTKEGVIKDCSFDGTIISEEAGGICAMNIGSITYCISSGELICENGGGICEVHLKKTETVYRECSFTGVLYAKRTADAIVNSAEPTDSGDDPSIIYDSCSFTGELISEYLATVFAGKTIKNCSINGEITAEEVSLCSGGNVKQEHVLIDNSFNVQLNHVSSVSISQQSSQIELQGDNVVELTGTFEENQVQIDSSLLDMKIQINNQRPDTNIKHVTNEEELFNCTKFSKIVLENDITLSKQKQISKYFKGELDGNGHTISNVQTPLFYILGSSSRITNLKITESNPDLIQLKERGLVANMNKGVISNITVSNSEIYQPKTDSVGCIVGSVSSNTISDITIQNTTVIGEDTVGAVCGIGNELDTIEIINVQVCGEHRVGGISGESNTIDNSTVRDSVVAGALYVGGVVGSKGKIQQTYVTDTIVKGKEQVGGIIGGSPTVVYSCSVKNTDISGSGYVGGICGKCSEHQQTKIEKCIVNADIEGERMVGGITGVLERNASLTEQGLISECTCNGTVKGRKQTGGISGKLENACISKSVCLATVYGTSSFVDSVAEQVSIENCFINSETTSECLIRNHPDEIKVTNLFWNDSLSISAQIGSPIGITSVAEFKTLFV